MILKPSFTRDLSNYFTARIALVLLGIATFPLMTRILSVADYGIVSLTLRLVLLLSVLSKCGLQYSAARFWNETVTAGDEAARRRFYSTLLLGPSISALLVIAVALPALIFFRSRITDPLLYRCLLLAPLLVVVRSLQAVLLSFLRNEGRSRLHSTLEVCTRLLTLLALLTLVFQGTRSAFHVIAATVFTEGVLVAYQVLRLLRRRLLLLSAMDWNLIRTSVIFGAPLIGYELASIVLDSGDRLLVRHYLGDTQLGLYSAAYNVSGYLQDTVMTPLNLAIFPIYMSIWNEQGRAATQAFLSTALTWFLVLACAISGLSILCSPDAIVLLASNRYSAAHHLLPILIPGLMIYATHIFLNVGLILAKRTGLLAALVVASAVANLALNVVLIPKFGLLGGAWATLLGYALLIGLLVRANRSILPLRPDFGLVLRAAVATALAAVATSHLHASQPVMTLVERVPTDLALFLLLFIVPSKSLRRSSRVWMSRFLTDSGPTSPDKLRSTVNVEDGAECHL